ncbi:CAP domain-containing protein [Clostridium saccharoperbutylacetonicum]
MKKAFLTKIVTGVIAATTMTTIAPLGVSAATTNSTYDNFYNYYNSLANSIVNSGWVKDNGNWYYFDNSGAKQTGVLNINGKTYCFNPSGIMQTGKVAIGNKTYTCSDNGQVIGSKTPSVDKVFDSTNNVVKDTNKTTTVSNQNKNETTTNAGTTTNTANTNSGAKTTSSTSNTASVDVQGLPKLPTNYSVSIQTSAEDKILELMNAKRVEAGLKPLTLDKTLISVARYKSNDMIQNNFFDHTNPDGTKWTNWLQALGYSYTTTGENIAYNTYDAVELFTQWWNSPGHRANMMNASYTKVGIGVVYGNGKYMGSQEFSN